VCVRERTEERKKEERKRLFCQKWSARAREGKREVDRKKKRVSFSPSLFSFSFPSLSHPRVSPQVQRLGDPDPQVEREGSQVEQEGGRPCPVDAGPAPVGLEGRRGEGIGRGGRGRGPGCGRRRRQRRRLTGGGGGGVVVVVVVVVKGPRAALLLLRPFLLPAGVDGRGRGGADERHGGRSGDGRARLLLRLRLSSRSSSGSGLAAVAIFSTSAAAAHFPLLVSLVVALRGPLR